MSTAAATSRRLTPDMASRVRHKDDRPRKAYVMSQQKGPDGQRLHTWPEIADRLGYPSRWAAQMAADRYGKALTDPDEVFNEQAPWHVPQAQQAEYCYKMWLLHKRRESGRRMTSGELGQLVKFEDALGPLPEAPHGLAVLFDEVEGTWKQRPRRENEGMFVEQ